MNPINLNLGRLRSMNKRFTSVISTLLFTVLSVNVSQAQRQSDNFSAQQLTQAASIKEQALESNLAWDLVESLTTEVGPRMPGTPGDKAAVLWAVAKFKAMGFDKVWTEPATFPKWIRYSESAAIISPAPQAMHITALGNSISTPKDGIQAQIIEFKDLSELESSP